MLGWAGASLGMQEAHPPCLQSTTGGVAYKKSHKNTKTTAHKNQTNNTNLTKPNNTNQTYTGSNRYIYYSTNILALKWPGSWQLLQQPWKVVEEGPGTVTLERPGTKIFQSCGVWASGRMSVRDFLVTCSLWINRRSELVVTGKSWCVKQLESQRASENDSGWMWERRWQGPPSTGADKIQLMP